MSSYFNIDLTQRLSSYPFNKEEVAKVVGSGADEVKVCIELWAQHVAVNHFNIDEFIKDRNIKNPRLIIAVKKIINDVESGVRGNDDLTCPISSDLSNDYFTKDQIDLIVGIGKERTPTPIELWARYFAIHGSNMEKLLAERGIRDPKLITGVKKCIRGVEYRIRGCGKHGADREEHDKEFEDFLRERREFEEFHKNPRKYDDFDDFDNLDLMFEYFSDSEEFKECKECEVA